MNMVWKAGKIRSSTKKKQEQNIWKSPVDELTLNAERHWIGEKKQKILTMLIHLDLFTRIFAKFYCLLLTKHESL